MFTIAQQYECPVGSTDPENTERTLTPTANQMPSGPAVQRGWDLPASKGRHCGGLPTLRWTKLYIETLIAMPMPG